MLARPSIAAVALSLFLAPAASPPLTSAASQATPPSQAPRDPGRPESALPAGAGVIAGIVVLDSGRPARRARLSLAGTNPSVSRTAIADDQGVFAFEKLPASTYTLTASRPGALNAVYGQKVPGSGRPGTPIPLAAGQRLDRLTLTMARGSVITGLVLDEFGDPIASASVRALRYVVRNGARTLVNAATATTDDRGIYRLINLVPGDYLVNATTRDQLPTDMVRAAMERDLTARSEAIAVARGADAAVLAQLAANQRAAAAASAPAEPTDAYATVYYPGSSSSASASTLAMGAGEERSGVDLQLQRVPVARLSGSIVSPPESSFISEVQLLDRGSLLPLQGVRSTQVQPGGTFIFTGVPPGRHTIAVFAALPAPTSAAGSAPPAVAPRSVALEEMLAGRAAAPRSSGPRDLLYASLDVMTIGQPMEGVVLTMQPGMAVSGSVVFEGGPPPADLTRVMMRAMLTDSETTALAFEMPGTQPAALDATGRFTVRGVMPGHYRIGSGPVESGFTIKSAVFGGRDVLDFPLEVKPGEDVSGGVVTFTTRTTEIAGALVDAAGAPTADYTVVVFAADSRFWTPQSRRIQAVRPATDGRFSFRGLPAGEYRLVAVTDVEPGQWFVPEFLRDLVAGAALVTLGDGEKTTQTLRVVK